MLIKDENNKCSKSFSGTHYNNFENRQSERQKNDQSKNYNIPEYGEKDTSENSSAQKNIRLHLKSVEPAGDNNENAFVSTRKNSPKKISCSRPITRNNSPSDSNMSADQQVSQKRHVRDVNSVKSNLNEQFQNSGNNGNFVQKNRANYV